MIFTFNEFYKKTMYINAKNIKQENVSKMTYLPFSNQLCRKNKTRMKTLIKPKPRKIRWSNIRRLLKYWMLGFQNQENRTIISRIIKITPTGVGVIKEYIHFWFKMHKMLTTCINCLTELSITAGGMGRQIKIVEILCS